IAALGARLARPRVGMDVAAAEGLDHSVSLGVEPPRLSLDVTRRADARAVASVALSPAPSAWFWLCVRRRILDPWRQHTAVARRSDGSHTLAVDVARCRA